MEAISSLTPFPSTTKSGTKKSLGEIMVSLTRERMASLVLNLLFLLIGYIFLFSLNAYKSRRFLLITCRLLSYIKSTLLVFLKPALIYLLHFLSPVGDYKPIAHVEVNSLRYFLFFRWFLIQKEFLYHEPN